MRSGHRANPQRGAALLLALVVLGSLAAGGALVLQQTNVSLQAQGSVRAVRSASYCAEAGLAAGRDFFRLSPSSWSTYLQTSFELTGQAGVGGAGLGYRVRLVDNADEFPPLVNSPLVDSDQTVIMVSRCDDPENPLELRQYLTTATLEGQRTGFVYTTSDDQAEQLPLHSVATATLQGGAEVKPVGGGAPRLLDSAGMALRLDGVSGAALFNDDAVLNGVKGVEVAFWFKADPAQVSQSTLISKSHGAASADTSWSVEFDTSGRRVRFLAYTTVETGGASAWSAVPVNDNQWHHLVGRYDGRYISLYLDNVLQSFTAASGDVRTNNLPLSVGRWESGPSRYYKGYMAELQVRTWNAPVFRGMDGGVAIKFGATDTTGPQGQPALLFNGTSARAQVINAPQLNGQEGLEVSFWFRADPSQVDHADVLSKGHGAASDDTGWNVEFVGNTGRLGFGVYTDGGGGSAATLSAVNDNQWHFLQGVYDGEHVSLWLDHLLQARQPASGKIKTNGKVLTVGGWELGPSRFFRGAIADLTVRSYEQSVAPYQEGLMALQGSGVTVGAGHDGATNALVFNGSSSRAFVPDSPFYRPLSGPKGVEVAFWMRADQTQVAHATVLSKGHGIANGDTGWTFEFDSGGTKLGFGVYTTSGTWGVSYPTALNDGNWHEVRGVYDGRRVYLHVDQALRVSANAGAGGDLLMNAKPATVGYWEYDTSRHFRGSLESVRINPLYSPGDQTTFWTVGQVQPGYETWQGNDLPANWLTLDWSGDRMTDLFHVSGVYDVTLWRSKGVADWQVSTYAPYAGYGVRAGLWRTGDFNGDGKGDLAHLCCGTYMHTWLSRGDGTFDAPEHHPGGFYDVQAGSWQVGDVTGDGKADLLHICCSNYIHTWISNGDGSYATPAFSPGGGYDTQVGSWQVGDVNGDGKKDLLHLCCSNYMHTWLSNGDGTYNVQSYSPWGSYNIQNGKWLVADINGDGKDDLVHIVGNSNYVHTWLSNGNGSYTVGTYSPASVYDMNNGEWLVGDLDEDNRMDLVHVVHGTDYVRPWRSVGNGTFIVGQYSPWAGYGIPNGRWLIGDVNRDRKADVIHAADPDAVNTFLSRF